MLTERLLPNPVAWDFIEAVDELATRDMDPIVDDYERAHRYPRDVFSQLARVGVFSLPFPKSEGGGGQPYEVYLQVLEQIAQHWASVATAVSVHGMATLAVTSHGDEQQKQRFLPDLLEGRTLAGYSLSEPWAGSDVAALRCRAEATDDGYRITGEKSWITHGGRADLYILFARTARNNHGVSAFVAPGETAGLAFSPSIDKMALNAVPTTSAFWDGALLGRDRRLGAEGAGLAIALGALDTGRLAIAAVATGLAQAALDVAVTYGKQREAFGRRILDHQGLGFLLADMAAAVDSARALYIDAARRRDRGWPFTRPASVAKLVATDAAMKVTTDAVQVLAGAGYTTAYPAERYMREAKVMQIFEGTNQIQRLVISRQLADQPSSREKVQR